MPEKPFWRGPAAKAAAAGARSARADVGATGPQRCERNSARGLGAHGRAPQNQTVRCPDEAAAALRGVPCSAATHTPLHTASISDRPCAPPAPPPTPSPRRSRADARGAARAQPPRAGEDWKREEVTSSADMDVFDRKLDGTGDLCPGADPLPPAVAPCGGGGGGAAGRGLKAGALRLGRQRAPPRWCSSPRRPRRRGARTLTRWRRRWSVPPPKSLCTARYKGSWMLS